MEKKSVVTVTPVRSIRIELQLSMEDAEALLGMSYKIGGSPSESPRGMFDDLNNQLQQALPHTTMAQACKDWIVKGDGFIFQDYNKVLSAKQEQES